MQTTLKQTIILATLLASAVALTACLHDEDDGGASVPANGVTITDANAEAMVASSAAQIGVLDSGLAVETTPTLGLQAALELIKPQIDNAKSASSNSGADPVYASDGNFSGNCTIGGTFSATGHSTATSDTGSATFVDCEEIAGFVLNGAIAWNETFDASGDYSETFSGTIGIVVGGGSTEITFTSLLFVETGNDLNFGAETYTTTSATVSIDFVVSGVGSGGFLVTLTAPIVESNGGDASCPESGTIRITGANGTFAEGTYNGDGTMTISANGTVVNAAATCY